VLDSIGFTSVDIEANEENLSALLNHYWTTDDKTAWECLEDLCKATQTVAYFDEFDNLKFRTLRSIYHDALYMPPKMIITTDDLPQGLANIISINEGDVTDINKVNLDYVTLKEADISRSGVPVMEAVWEPDGTQVLRAGALVD